MKLDHLVAGKLGQSHRNTIATGFEINRLTAWRENGFFHTRQMQGDLRVVERRQLFDDLDAASAGRIAARELNDSPAADRRGIEEMQYESITL